MAGKLGYDFPSSVDGTVRIDGSLQRPMVFGRMTGADVGTSNKRIGQFRPDYVHTSVHLIKLPGLVVV